MDPRVGPIASQLRTNEGLVRRALEGLDLETAMRRPVAGANPLAFIAVHVVDARAHLVGILGGDATHPLSAPFAAAERFEDLDPVPAPSQLVQTFDLLSARLEERLKDTDRAALEAPSGMSFPTGDDTVLGALAFLSFHESYHVGQMSMLQRALGRGSLSGV